MKFTIYSILLLIVLGFSAQSLQAQCAVAATVTGPLSCSVTQVTLNAVGSPNNVVYSWSGPGGFAAGVQNPVVNLPGSYSVTVTNPGDGCTATGTAIVTQDIVVPNLSVTSNGTITCIQPIVTLTANSTTLGLTYLWYGPYIDGSNLQNPTITNPGTFTVVVSAPNGCTASQAITVDSIGHIPQLNSSIPTAPTCGGVNNGAIDITLSGGMAPYTFGWSGPNGYSSNTQNPTGMPGGVYSLTITDAISCSSVYSVNLIAPPPLVITQTGASPVNCYGGSNGTISVGVNGGTPPYGFGAGWNNGTNTANLQNLPAGSYWLTVSDAQGCLAVSQFVVSQPSPIVIASFICESSIAAVVSGGMAPYQYIWSDGETGPTANSLQAGAYTVTVQDARGCFKSSASIVLSAGNNPSCTRIIGRVVFDENEDCLPDPSEIGLGAWYVKAEGATGIFYGVTDSAGHYDIRLEPGDYIVSAIPPSPLSVVCVPGVAVSLPQTGDSAVVNFTVQGSNLNCPAMTVDLSVGLLRRCFSNNYYTLQYCNNSPVEASNAYILLTLDPFLSIVSSPRPYTALGNNIYQFNLGLVTPFECGQFNVQINVSCNATLGQTHCSEAHIFPDTLCGPLNPLWSGAEVFVRSECATDSLHFILKNIGNGPMTNPLNYIVIEDGIMGLQGNHPPLAVGDSIIVSVPANGSTWRIEAQQADYFPGLSVPALSVEGCSTTSLFSMGYVQQFATNDADPFIDVDCTANTDSFDPNDKQGMPIGYGAAHYIRPGTDIEYLIRFQNTGTDTAFTVIVRDTLAPWLDPTTVFPGGSSHDYHFNITGNGILIFDFQNILLPDSNVNEAASHGFLKFRVSQRAEVPLETDILNRAAIYFDFNDPIMTNTTVHRVGERFLTIVGLWQPARPTYHVQIAPHPLRDASWLQVQGVPEQGNCRLRLYDATGRAVQEMDSSSPQFRVEKSDLPSGLYMFRVEMDGVLVGRGTLLAQ